MTLDPGSILILTILLLFAGCGQDPDINTLAGRAKAGDDRAGRALVRAMGRADRDQSLEAYRTIIEVGPDAEDWLIDGLGSPDRAVVEASSAALGNLGSRESVPVLIGILDQEDKRPYAAALALGEIGAVEAVPHLVRALSSGNTGLRKAAVRALVRIGPDAVGPVLPVLGRHKDPMAQRAAINVIGELRAPEGVDALKGVTGANRDAAVRALGRIGDPAGLETLLDALTDGRWTVRREAAKALGSLEDTAAVVPLEAALEDPETVVREWAARSLEVLTGRQVLYVDAEGKRVPPYSLYR